MKKKSWIAPEILSLDGGSVEAGSVAGGTEGALAFHTPMSSNVMWSGS